MIFHSAVFVFIYLPTVLVGFYAISRVTKGDSWTLLWLAVCSLIFYGWGEHSFVLLIAGSAVFNFAIGYILARYNKTGDQRTASILLTLGILANLCLLGYFKYANFFIDNVAAFMGLTFSALNILLPLAISFFTLQQIAYLVDVRRGLVNEASFLRYLLFVTFFPQLIAGPIVHHSEMMPQFRGLGRRFDRSLFSDGLTLFLLGLAKKIILADPLAGVADPIFATADSGSSPSLFIAWIGLLAFSLQIYFDFSAYSDMAIGLGKMFGIRLPENFRSPYKASNIIDFWRRWHMTLSRFLRDYLYIPLGGNRFGSWGRYRNLMLTMLIGGLWHGAAWGFVVWGGLHGLYLAINHMWQKYRSDVKQIEYRSSRVIGIALTFFATTIAWIFFRAETFGGALEIFYGIIGSNGAYLPAQAFDLVPALLWIAHPATVSTDAQYALPFMTDGLLVLLGLCIVFMTPTIHEMSMRVRVGLLILCGGLIFQGLIYGTQTEFIYFRF